MSEADTPSSLPGTPTPRPPRRPRLRWGRWLILGALAAIFLPQLPGYVRYEWKAWQAAPLLKQYNQAFVATPPDTAAMKKAEEKFSEITGEDCKSTVLVQQRIAWRIELEDYKGALADLDKLLATLKESGSTPSRSARKLRCQLLLLTDKPKEALELVDKLEETAADSLSEFDLLGERVKLAPYDWDSVNFAAYTRAILDKDLDKALVQIERVIENAGAIPAFLDTRGFVRYKRREYPEALADLEGAIAAYKWQEDWEAFFKANRGEATSILSLKVKHKRIMREVAVVYYHRGLIYDALDRQEEARRDFDHVRALGYEPSTDLF